MNRRTGLSIIAFMAVFLGLVASCREQAGSGDPRPAAPPGASVAALPAASAAPSAPAPPRLATSKINGKILNEVEMTDIGAALKKAGWTDQGGSGMAIGAIKTISVNAEKDSVKAKLTLIKPSGDPDRPGGLKMASAKDQVASYQAKGAALLDGDVLVAVEIEGKNDEAKTLLDAVIER